MGIAEDWFVTSVNLFVNLVLGVVRIAVESFVTLVRPFVKPLLKGLGNNHGLLLYC